MNLTREETIKGLRVHASPAGCVGCPLIADDDCIKDLIQSSLYYLQEKTEPDVNDINEKLCKVIAQLDKIMEEETK